VLQKLLQFSQTYRQVNKNWYIGEDMNGKQLGKFSRAEVGHKWKYMQVLKGYFFDSPSMFNYSMVAKRVRTC